MLLAVDIDPSWMLLAGIALLVWVLMRRVIRKRKGTPQARFGSSMQPAHSRRSSSTTKGAHQPLIDAPRELIRWQVDMHDTARDLKAELDSKIHIVQTLVRMAREESDRLEAAIAEAQRLGVSYRGDVLEQTERVAREQQ